MKENPSTSVDAPTNQHIGMHWRKGEALTLPFLNLKYSPIQIYVVRLSKTNHAFVHVVDRVALMVDCK
jgi:hypothetical protein